MAIFADFTKTTYTISETETVQEEVTYPSEMEEDDPNYSKRGQTLTETFPLVTSTDEILQNVYIVISNYNFYKFEKTENDEYLFDIQFKIYNDKQTYLDDYEDFVHESDAVGEFRTITSTDDLRIRGYEILKSLPNITNITDD